ncbi:MAG: ABC transporter ATP-binding protein [Verrucomicrobia bacterium]|nr:ABC transporter ATP-binding protein [Verrucomicrobiota bacterium]
MSESIISVSNLSKSYILDRRGDKSDGLRHLLENAVRKPTGILRGMFGERGKNKSIFWALKDLNLDVERGGMVGIIGRNGAGKSTLLKLLSRITEPTSGKIQLRGKVASLLEVGTGFHPELTGRENIFLNGAILGMSRREIKNRFDEIVDFSEVEKFLDTPVKRYSSGMYVRLAFAVAAHLEPEILIVDEVLAVGDSEFQKKCVGKMEDASSREGRTVLLVSHQLPLIQNLCNRCVLMDQGRIIADGPTDEVIGTYMTRGANLVKVALKERKDRAGKGRVQVIGVAMRDADGNVMREAISGSEVRISFEYVTRDGITVENCIFCVEIKKEARSYIALSTALVHQKKLDVSGPGRIDFIIPKWPLMEGTYHINTYVGSNGVMEDFIEDAASIDVIDGDFHRSGKLRHEGWRDMVLVDHSWQHAVGETSNFN